MIAVVRKCVPIAGAVGFTSLYCSQKLAVLFCSERTTIARDNWKFENVGIPFGVGRNGEDVSYGHSRISAHRLKIRVVLFSALDAVDHLTGPGRSAHAK